MPKVKVFHTISAGDLERELNAFSSQEGVTVDKIATTANNSGLCAVVTYTEKEAKGEGKKEK